MDYSTLRCYTARRTMSPLSLPVADAEILFGRDSAGKSKFIRRVNRTRAVKCRRQAATMLLQQIVCAYEIWE